MASATAFWDKQRQGSAPCAAVRGNTPQLVSAVSLGSAQAREGQTSWPFESSTGPSCPDLHPSHPMCQPLGSHLCLEVSRSKGSSSGVSEHWRVAALCRAGAAHHMKKPGLALALSSAPASTPTLMASASVKGATLLVERVSLPSVVATRPWKCSWPSAPLRA